MEGTDVTNTRSSEQVRAFVHGMWASVAASWGASADDIDQRVAPITERMLDAVAVHTGDRVLELASGPEGVLEKLEFAPASRASGVRSGV